MHERRIALEKKASEYCTDYLLKKQNISNMYREIYVYGFELFFSTVFTGFTIFLIGTIFFKASFSLIFITIFTSLRILNGGYHADTFTKCFIYSNFFFIISVLPIYHSAILLSGYTYVIIGFMSGIVILFLGPLLDKCQEKLYSQKKKFQIYTLGLLIIYISISIFLLFFYKSNPYIVVISNTLLLVAVLQLKVKFDRLLRK